MVIQDKRFSPCALSLMPYTFGLYRTPYTFSLSIPYTLHRFFIYTVILSQHPQSLPDQALQTTIFIIRMGFSNGILGQFG